MRKILLFICFSFSLINLFSFDNDEFGVSLGYLGVGINADTEIADFYINGKILNIMYQSNNGLGISFSPFTFFTSVENTDDFSLSFIDISLFFNTLKLISHNFILGPFFTVNALNYNDTFFIFRSGFVFSLRNLPGYYLKNNILNTDIFSVELGYKYDIIGNNYFYSHVCVDLLTAIWYVGLGKESEVNKYRDF